MVARKKTGRKMTEAKDQLIILAVYPKPVGLAPMDLKRLKEALKTAGETSVRSYESLETVVALVSEQGNKK